MKGFVDLQVNGYAGVDFSGPDLSVQRIREAVGSLVDRGTVAFCPTVITSPVEIYERNLPLLAQAMDEPDLKPHLLGIHLEGPFISPEDGARGAHNLKHTRLPDAGLLDTLLSWSDDRVSLVTLAPELPGALELIPRVLEAGAVVSLGHHLAGREVIAGACDQGAAVSTHLGNGIPNVLPRHPNPILDQLDENRLAATIITDGHHLPDSFIRVVFRQKTPERVIVVSDSAPIAGRPPGVYETLGQKVVLEESGRLWNPEGDHLVGSSSCLLECMNNLADIGILSEGELWTVGWRNPLELLGLDLNDDRWSGLPDVILRDGRFIVDTAGSPTRRQ